MKTDCKCDGPGYCEYLGRKMGDTKFRQCSQEPQFHELFVRESKAGRYNHPAYQGTSGVATKTAEPNKRKVPLLGDAVSGVLRRIGITPDSLSDFLGKDCGCKERREKLNKLDAWARENASLSGLMRLISGRKSENCELKISSAVTTSERKEPTLRYCISSLKLAGFSPVVYAEPDADTDGISERVIRRDEKLGCWQNWIQSLRDTIDSDPSADAVAMFQDDCILSLGVNEFLSKSLWPHKKTGVVSLYTCQHYTKRHKGNGFVHIPSRYLLGALAYVFPMKVAVALANVTDWRGHWKPDRKLDGQLKKSVDTFVGHQMARMGLRPYFHIPSLAQHIGFHSTISNGRSDVAKRTSSTFVGEGFDATTLIKGEAYHRESL